MLRRVLILWRRTAKLCHPNSFAAPRGPARVAASRSFRAPRPLRPRQPWARPAATMARGPAHPCLRMPSVPCGRGGPAVTQRAPAQGLGAAEPPRRRAGPGGAACPACPVRPAARRPETPSGARRRALCGVYAARSSRAASPSRLGGCPSRQACSLPPSSQSQRARRSMLPSLHAPRSPPPGSERTRKGAVPGTTPPAGPAVRGFGPPAAPGPVLRCQALSAAGGRIPDSGARRLCRRYLKSQADECLHLTLKFKVKNCGVSRGN